MGTALSVFIKGGGQNRKIRIAFSLPFIMKENKP